MHKVVTRACTVALTLLGAATVVAHAAAPATSGFGWS